MRQSLLCSSATPLGLDERYAEVPALKLSRLNFKIQWSVAWWETGTSHSIRRKKGQSEGGRILWQEMEVLMIWETICALNRAQIPSCTGIEEKRARVSVTCRTLKCIESCPLPLYLLNNQVV